MTTEHDGLVSRLRNRINDAPMPTEHLLDEAADEIERLNRAADTLSRCGLETLVLDSERYAEQNAKLVAEHLEYKAAFPDPTPLEEQLEQLRRKYPDASVGERTTKGERLLSVPGVKLPRGWAPRETTLYIIIPEGFPHSQPNRFYTPQDVRLDHGGFPKNTAHEGSAYGGKIVDGLMWWHWAICHPNYRHRLTQYVNAMRRRFSVKE